MPPTMQVLIEVPPLPPPACQPPPSFKRLVARGVGESFREVADVAEVPMPAPGPDDILVRVEWAGINGG